LMGTGYTVWAAVWEGGGVALHPPLPSPSPLLTPHGLPAKANEGLHRERRGATSTTLRRRCRCLEQLQRWCSTIDTHAIHSCGDHLAKGSVRPHPATNDRRVCGGRMDALPLLIMGAEMAWLLRR
jgi:hypothetical protein